MIMNNSKRCDQNCRQWLLLLLLLCYYYYYYYYYHYHYFWFLFNQPIFSESLILSWVPQKGKFRNAGVKFFYKLDALPVAQPTLPYKRFKTVTSKKAVEPVIWLTWVILISSLMTGPNTCQLKASKADKLRAFTRWKSFSFSSQNGSLQLATNLPASLPVPVSQRHHDVQWRQEEYEVKETVAVCNSVSLVICWVLSSMLHISITSWTRRSYNTIAISFCSPQIKLSPIAEM